jgi:hypothetical protein
LECLDPRIAITDLYGVDHLAKSIAKIRVMGSRDWRSEFALAERMFPKDLGKPEAQLAIQNNLSAVNQTTNVLVLVPERAALLAERSDGLRRLKSGILISCWHRARGGRKLF